MILGHIYNVAAIVDKIKETRTDKNIYDKINILFKGGMAGVKPEILKEVIYTLEAEHEKIMDFLRTSQRELISAEAMKKDRA